MVNKDRFNKEIARIFSPVGRIERMRRRKVTQAAPANNPELTDLTKVQIVSGNYMSASGTESLVSVGAQIVSIDNKPVRDVKSLTLDLPLEIITGTDIPDLSAVENLKVSFPDFEVLGIKGSNLPSKEKLASAVREMVDLLDPDQIGDLVDSVIAFEDGVVTVALSADNLSPVKLRISLEEFNEKIAPFVRESSDGVLPNNGIGSGSNNDSSLDSSFSPDPPKIKTKYTVGPTRIHGSGGYSHKSKLIGASFPDLEALGYRDELPGDLMDVFREWSGERRSEREQVAFRALFTAKKVRGTLTHSDGSAEPVEWTIAEYEKEYKERLHSL